MFDKKIAEFNYKLLSRIVDCGGLVSTWNTAII